MKRALPPIVLVASMICAPLAYCFRSVVEELGQHHDDDTASLFLDETDSWQEKYAPGKLKRKRLDVFADTFIPQEE